MLCVFFFAFIVGSFLFNMLPFEASAEPELSVHNINTEIDFETIQEAINDPNTLDGHTIAVDEGTYYENVVVNKSVSLVGEDKFRTIVDGRAIKTVINVIARYVTITGFAIREGGPGEGIYVHHSSHGNNISYNIVMNNSVGIWLNGSNNNILLGNNCTSNTFDGMFLKSSHNNTLLGNIALDNAYGFWVEASSGNSLIGNNASNNRNTGFWITSSSENKFSGNAVSKELFGFWVEKSRSNVISGNVISCGNNSYGITFADSGNNTVEGNTASNNFVGIRLGVQSGGNTIFHNNFDNNNETLRGVAANSLDNGVDGNYWSDYNGTDNNRDGIGDTPYVKNANNTDYYPLMGMFSAFNVDVEGEMCHVFAICNCTIFGLNFNDSARIVSFNITGPNNVTAFCRIMIPKLLISYEPYVISVAGEEVEANLLPPSNITHAFLYFEHTLSTLARITIVSRSYYELLEKIRSLSADFYNLNGTYYDLRYTNANLNTTYQMVLSNYTALQENLDSLQVAYDDLSELYNSLNSTIANLKSSARVSTAAFIVAMILGTAVLLPFGVKYYLISREQKKIIQAYSPFEVASALFRTDVERRQSKIGKFEEKYGVRIRPRNSLDDVVRTIEKKKRVKR